MVVSLRQNYTIKSLFIMKDNSTKLKVYNLIILDKSGSMSSIANAAIDGFNETVNGIRQAQERFADTQEHYLTLRVFCDCEQRDVYDCTPIAQVRKLTSNDYQPCCSTPLYDAVGFSLTKLRKVAEKEPGSTFVVTVITDGLENASREYSGSQVAQMIMELRHQGWTFGYMGADHDVEAVASQMNINNTRRFEHTSAGVSIGLLGESEARMRHYIRLNRMSIEHPSMSSCEQSRFIEKISNDYYESEASTEIFVFGSNILGCHDGGAALRAVENYGAVVGQAEGRQGNAYAIPTVGVGLDEIKLAVGRFVQYALDNKDLTFTVTAIGCGHAGFTPSQIAPLFAPLMNEPHVALPREFRRVLNTISSH